ncbi:MAG: glycoside-pentoside-hexuronide (GPH):cation symporter [Candidatus Izemoplasma sp.]|nr:glycoside-pentoside-hexuronide (GPH):cation symporter [Candidatus Izemoplasma sp.]
MTSKKLTKKTKFAYALGGLGKDMMFATSTYMMFYFNDLLGISSAFLGVMIMVVRIWDAINDPIMGTIVDKTESRWGKFRPWILIGTVLNAFILVMLFLNPGFQTNSIIQLVYVTTFYTLWGMTYTLMDIPFWSMIPALSYDQKEREDVTVLTRLFTSIGYFIVAGGYITFAHLLAGGDTPEAEIRGLLIFAIIVAVIFVITEIITVTNVKENIQPADKEKRSLKKMFELLKKNDQLLVVMVVVLTINFTLYITSGMAIYYITYAVGNSDYFIIFMAVGGILQMLGTIVFYQLRNYFNRKKIFNLAILIQFVGFILLFFNAFLFKSHVVLLFVFAGIVFLGQGIFMVIQTVILSDTVEYGEWKTHKRSESIAFSVQTFVVKMAMGLSSGVIGIGLAIINFVPSRQINGVITRFEQSSTTLLGMSLIMFILPLFGLLIGQFVFNKTHILDEAKYALIVKELKLRKEAKDETDTTQ